MAVKEEDYTWESSVLQRNNCTWWCCLSSISLIGTHEWVLGKPKCWSQFWIDLTVDFRSAPWPFNWMRIAKSFRCYPRDCWSNNLLDDLLWCPNNYKLFQWLCFRQDRNESDGFANTSLSAFYDRSNPLLQYIKKSRYTLIFCIPVTT